jgi:hypothetical protein
VIPDDLSVLEERVRAATRARTDLVQNVRPLELREKLSEPVRRTSTGRHWFIRSSWSGWLIPLTAAAAIVAVAGTLVAVRTNAGPAANSTPAGESSSSAEPSSVALPTGVPPYYVTLGQIPKSGNAAAVLGDTSTGKALLGVQPPVKGSSWQDVAMSASENTFVIYGGVSSAIMTNVPTTATKTEVFDVLRVPAGKPQQTKVTRLTLAGPSYAGAVSEGGLPVSSEPTITGAAVSPDGQTLAVLSQITKTKKVTVHVPVVSSNPAASPSTTPITSTQPAGTEEITLRTYSLATGQVLHTWTESPSSNFQDVHDGSLSWQADGHTLSWFTDTDSPSAVKGDLDAVHSNLETLDTASSGTSLAADSQTVWHTLDTSCGDPTATADGKSVICADGASGPAMCAKGLPEVDAYSLSTGKLENVLYRYKGSCQFGAITPMWAPSSSFVIAERLINGTEKRGNQAIGVNIALDVSVMTPTKLTKLPITQSGALSGSFGFAAF